MFIRNPNSQNSEDAFSQDPLIKAKDGSQEEPVKQVDQVQESKKKKILENQYQAFFENQESKAKLVVRPTGPQPDRINDTVARDQWIERREEARKNSRLSKKLDVPSTVWDPDLKLYVTNPAIVELEIHQQEMTTVRKNANRVIPEKLTPSKISSVLNDTQIERQRRNINDLQEKMMNKLRKKFSEVVLWRNLNTDDNLKCDLCLDANSYIQNALIVCELCLTAVHQTCYGREIKIHIPEVDWFCARCTKLRTINIEKEEKGLKGKDQEVQRFIKCSLCPSVKGILLKLLKGPMKGQWVHPVCVNWSNECSYQSKQVEVPSGNPIKDLFDQDAKFMTEITCRPKSMNLYECNFCKSSEGATIKCDFGDCQTRFHVRCAIKGSCIKTRAKMTCNVSSLYPGMVYIFCKDHRVQGPRFLKQTPESQDKIEAQEVKLKGIKLSEYVHIDMPATGESSQIDEDCEGSKFASEEIEEPSSHSEDSQEGIKQETVNPDDASELKEVEESIVLSNRAKRAQEKKERKEQRAIEGKTNSESTPNKEKKQKRKKKKSTKKAQKSRSKVKKDKDSVTKYKSKQFGLDKQKLIEKALSKNKPRSSFSRNNNKNTEEMLGEQFNDSRFQKPQKEISGVGMHLLVEQLLRSQANQEQENDESPLQERQKTRSSSFDLVSPSKLESTEKYRVDPEDLVRVSPDFVKALNLQRAIWNIEDLLEKLVIHLRHTKMLTIIEDEDKKYSECVVELTGDPNLKRLLLQNTDGGTGFGFKVNSQNDVYKCLWALVAPLTTPIG